MKNFLLLFAMAIFGVVSFVSANENPRINEIAQMEARILEKKIEKELEEKDSWLKPITYYSEEVWSELFKLLKKDGYMYNRISTYILVQKKK